MATTPSHTPDHSHTDIGSGALGVEVAEGRGESAFTATGGEDLPVAGPGDDPADFRPTAKRKGRPRGSASYWGALPSDTRTLALPSERPITFREALAVLRQRRRSPGKKLERIPRANLEIRIDNLTTAELLRIVRLRAPDKYVDASGHYIPAGWKCSHPTIIKLEQQTATLLVDYWLKRGDLVVVP